MLATAWYSTSLRQVEVLQIVDDKNMLVNIGDDEIIWLEGFPTEDLVDGGTIEGLAAVLEVAGSKKYNTAIGGARTVPLLKPYPFDLNPAKAGAANRRQRRSSR